MSFPPPYNVQQYTGVPDLEHHGDDFHEYENQEQVYHYNHNAIDEDNNYNYNSNNDYYPVQGHGPSNNRMDHHHHHPSYRNAYGQNDRDAHYNNSKNNIDHYSQQPPQEQPPYDDVYDDGREDIRPYQNGMYQIPIHMRQQQPLPPPLPPQPPPHYLEQFQQQPQHYQNLEEIQEGNEDIPLNDSQSIDIFDDGTAAGSVDGTLQVQQRQKQQQQQQQQQGISDNSYNEDNESTRHISPIHTKRSNLMSSVGNRNNSTSVRSFRSVNSGNEEIIFGETASIHSGASYRSLLKGPNGNATTNPYLHLSKGINELRDPSYLIDTLQEMVPKVVNNQYANSTNNTNGNNNDNDKSANGVHPRTSTITGRRSSFHGRSDSYQQPEQQKQQQQQEKLNEERQQHRRDQAEYVWDCVRHWLWANPKQDEAGDTDNIDLSYRSLGGFGNSLSNFDDLQQSVGHMMPSNIDTRKIGASALGLNDMTPLHLVCKLSYPPEDIIEALVQAAPDSVTYKDLHGWLPLHYVCANGCSTEVMKILIDSYPASIVEQDIQKRTPLHFYVTRHSLCGDNPNIMSLNAIMLCSSVDHTVTTDTTSFPNTPDTDRSTPTHGARAAEGADIDGYDDIDDENLHGYSNHSTKTSVKKINAAQITDANGMLPIHYACAYGSHSLVLKAISDANPDGLVARERHGRVPLHLAMVNAHRDESYKVVKFLLEYNRESKDTINIRDKQGCLPIHLLATGLKQQLLVSKRKSSKYRLSNDIEKQHTISECLNLYLNAEPKPVADFLSAIKDLPDWLLDTAVVSKHVHNVLNKKIVQRLPTCIILLDGFILFMIIICFSIASKNHIDLRFDPTGSTSHTDVELALVLFGASYFCLREIIQFTALCSLGHTYRWFKDYANWLDVGVIVLVYYYGIKMVKSDQRAVISPAAFRAGIAFTQGLLWAAIIVYLKKLNVGFAVFVGGVFYVVQRLAAFIIAVGTILIAFGQMFYFIYVYTPICDLPSSTGSDIYLHDGSKVFTDQFSACVFPHCSFFGSFLKVYTMMMGNINGVFRYATNLEAQLLFLAYAFLVVILLSNVLIAIVQDSYEVVQNERAAIVFWYNRLEFIAEVDTIAYFVRRLWTGSDPKTKLKANVVKSRTKDKSDASSDMDMMLETLNEGSFHRVHDDHVLRRAWQQIMSLFEKNIYDNNSLIDSIIHNILCFISLLVIIPLWCMIGFVSVGLLWPPQIREMLFAQKETVVTRAELNRQKFDQLKEIEHDLNNLRTEIRDEMDHGRTFLQKVKADIEIIQSEINIDLVQIKELLENILTSMLNEEEQQ